MTDSIRLYHHTKLNMILNMMMAKNWGSECRNTQNYRTEYSTNRRESTMSKFTQLTKKAFEDYHNTPYEPAEWGETDALGHIMEFMAHHDSINEMQGLREALQAMTPKEWETWRLRYPEHQKSLIEPIAQEITHRSY
jgi:hypothetical protein